MAMFDGGNQDFFSSSFGEGSGGGSSMPSTLGGGDASQSTMSAGDPYGRKDQWGLLGLYGDNGNLSSMFGTSGLGTGGPQDTTQKDGWQGWDPNAPLQATSIENGGTGRAQQGFNNLDPGWLQSLGFNGPATINTGNNTEGGSRADQTNPALAQWLQSNGYNLQNRSDEVNSYGRLVDKNGSQIGSQTQWKSDPDDAFGIAMALAGGFAGAAVGGAAAGGIYGNQGIAGAASDAGSLGAGATGATTASVGTATPGWVTAAGQGAGGGFGSTLARTADVGQATKAGVIGGVTGGITQGLNPASYAGIDDPTLARGFNSATMAGGRAALTGGNVGSSVLGSLQTSALGAGLNYGANAIGGGSMPSSYDDSGMGDMFAGAGDYQPYSGGQMPSAPSYTGFNDVTDQSAPQDYSSYAGGGGYSPQGQAKPTQAGGNPVMDFAKSMFMPQSAGGGSGKPGNFDGLAGNLMQLWQSRKNASQIGGLADGLQSMYSPNSPYAQQLQQTLMRADAASGRRSQVGPRSVELQARLADLNSRNAPEIARLRATQQNNQGQQLQSLLRMGMNPMIQNGMGSLWDRFGYGGSQWQQPTADTNPDWAPGD